MLTMILISSAAVLVALVGSVVIWGLDAFRAEEIEHPRDATNGRHALGRGQAETPRSISAP